MRIYRQAGDREYQAVLRARAAEENAVSIENMSAELTSSQLPENTKTTDNIQASMSKIRRATRDVYEGQPTGLLSSPGRSEVYVNKCRKGGEIHKTSR